jgi:NAD(P)-dependent dehydrogenase (short-subunit alcohol dehydrogenase family)
LRCVEIRPGFIETDMLKAFDTRYLEIERNRLPGGRFSTPDEVAAEIVDRLFEGTS